MSNSKSKFRLPSAASSKVNDEEIEAKSRNDMDNDFGNLTLADVTCSENDYRFMECILKEVNDQEEVEKFRL